MVAVARATSAEASRSANPRWAGSRVAVFRSGYQAMKRLACACYYAAPEAWLATGYPGPPDLPFATEAE